MTGTAMTEAEEFYEIYKLDVVEVPTNRPNGNRNGRPNGYNGKSRLWKCKPENSRAG